MSDRKWTKGTNGLWTSKDRVLARAEEKRLAREAAERRKPMGARVRTRGADKIAGRNRLGVVENRSGDYVYVRLNYRGIVIERYDGELELKGLPRA